MTVTVIISFVACILSGPMPCFLCILSYSVFTIGNVHYPPHFSDEETEAGPVEVTCQKYPL